MTGLILIGALFALLVIGTVWESTRPTMRDLLEQEASSDVFFAQLDSIEREAQN